MQTSTRTLWVIATLALCLGTFNASAELSGDLEGLHKNNSTNWGPSSPWTGGNLQDWQELDYIVVRAVLNGGPQTNQPVELIFPKFKTGDPGFQNLYFISNSPNVTISNLMLNSPPAPADWSYTMNVTITNSQVGYIYFYARMAAGAHLQVGSSLQLSGEPALSPLQIHKPDAGPGSPDLAITKTGPSTAGPGDEITYTITYTNKAMGSNNTANGTQLSDQLPSLVTFVSASNGGTNEAGVITWDLGNLTNRASGSVTYVVRVSAAAQNGQMFTNNALILSSEDDANSLDNRSSVKTTVVANRPPTANPDSYTINEDTVLNVSAPGILANDTDPEVGTTLTAMLVTTTTNGVLNLNTNGSFVYTPNANYHGEDAFTYKASDGSNFSSTVVVSITINPTNDAPVATNDFYSMPEDSTLTVPAPGVLANDFDVDGDAVTAVLVTGAPGAVFNLNPDGSFTYTPSLNQTGTVTFTYRASDGALQSDVATVTITIVPTNDAPVAANDSYTVNEDTTLTVSAPGVLANDSDVDGDALAAVLVSNPAHGSLALQSNGGFVYTPTNNYNGTDSFTYYATDGSLNSGIATVTITVNPTNDAPVAVNDFYTMNEDTVLNVSAPGVLGNDSDVDGNALSAVILAQPTNGVVTLNANGSFVYRPNTNYNGIDAFTYRANDGSLTSGVAVVTITINPTNDAPGAVDDNYATLEDTTLTVSAPGVLGNDIDVDGNPLMSFVVANVTHGSLTLNANGSFTYTPSLNYTGLDLFTYRATDGFLSSTATVRITVIPTNDVPVAVNDFYTINEDTVLTVSAPGVLVNDSDVDGDALSAVILAQPTNGVVTLNPNGSFEYRPNTNYNGADAFTYRATDGSLTSGVAIVFITINPTNDAPGAVDDNYATLEDTTLTISAPGVLGNDIDVDGNPLTSFVVANVTHGSLTLNANGSFTYTPSLNYTGLDLFTYRATDGFLSSTATVRITVVPTNDAPVAVDDNYSTLEDTALTISAPGVLGNDSDVDGNPLTSLVVANVTHGNLTLNANGSFTYTPSLNYTGLDVFTYRATDGFLSSTATVRITIIPTNDAPVAVDDNYSTLEDTALTISAPGVLSNDSDVDGNPLTSFVVANVTHGNLTLNANGSFTYTPSLNYTGLDVFTYRATDGFLSSTAMVRITVIPTNDAPVAVNDNYAVGEDATLTIAAPGILVNDSDVDGDALTAVLVQNVTNGVLNFNANGSFSYTPSLNYTGVDTFTYRASDGTLQSGIATVTITVVPTNDVPVATNDFYSVLEDNTLTVAAGGILTNDFDVDGDALIAVLVQNVAHGVLSLNTNGAFVYTPSLNYTGIDTFTYVATDRALTSAVATVTIAVLPVNDAPVAQNNNYSVLEDNTLTVTAPGILGNDSDVDGDALSTVLVQNVTNGVLNLNANGSFTYTPSLNYTGVDTFTYRASDGALQSGVAVVTITVLPVNDPPVALNNSYTTPEDVPLNIPAPGVLGNDSDVDGDPLTAVVVSNPTNGLLLLNANGSFTYTPNANYNGPDSFTYVANDGMANSGIATVFITVTPVNDRPVAGGENYSVLEDQVLTVAAPGVLANDSDIDLNPLTAVLVTLPMHGTVVLNANGSFVYTPTSDYFGPDSFTYSANDGLTSSAPATVSITVIPVNDVPSFTGSGDQKVNENAGAQTVPGWAHNISSGPVNESDQTLNFIVSNDNNSLFSSQPAIAPDGTLTYTPAANQFGTATVRVTLHDSGGTANGGVDTSAEVVFRIVVNSPPNIAIVSPANGSALVYPAAYTVIASADDPDGTVTNVQFFINNVLWTNQSEAPFYFIQTNVATGSYQFLAIATDNCGLSATSAPVNITVVTNIITAVGPIVFNRMNSYFEQYVTISNRTSEAWPNGVRLFIANVISPNKVVNATGTNGGIPYIDKTNALAAGGSVQVLIQYYVPNQLTPPNPTLFAIPLPYTRPIAPPPVITQIAPGGGNTVQVQFTSVSQRFYFIQHTENFVNWTTQPQAVPGNGAIAISPQTKAADKRFFRVMLVP
jgi:large repetitive protein